jgi:hypothetical protein
VEKEKKKKRVYIPYYLSLFTRMCLTVCVVLISCFCIFPKFSSRGLRIRAVVVYMLLLKSCGFPFILNPVFFFCFFFGLNAQVTASSFDAQDALTSDPARLVVRGMMSWESYCSYRLHTHTQYIVYILCVCSLVVVVVVVVLV